MAGIIELCCSLNLNEVKELIMKNTEVRDILLSAVNVSLKRRKPVRSINRLLSAVNVPIMPYPEIAIQSNIDRGEIVYGGRLEELQEYKNANSHCNVPKKYK